MKGATFKIDHTVSPKEFLRLERTERQNILHTEVRPPRLGGNDFGKIVVTKRDITLVRKSKG